MGQRAQRTTFDIVHLSPQDRIRAWRENLAEVYCRQDVCLLQEDEISGQISRRSVGDLIISKFRSGGAQRVMRTNEMVKSDGVEHYHIALPSSGQFLLSQAGVETHTGKGDAFIINASSPFILEFSSDAEDLVVALPCDVLRQRVMGIDDFISQHQISDQFVIHMIGHACAYALQSDTNLDERKIQNLIVDLLDMGVASDLMLGGDEVSSARRAGALVENVRIAIRRNLADPTFGLDAAATACGVSTRQIQKVLARRNTTFGKELLNTRLTVAAYLLQTRSGSSISIGKIAIDCGFAHQSYFSSCFRQRFGMSPRDAQRKR